MSPVAYDLKSVKLPRLAGSGLRTFVALMENAATRGMIIPKLLRDGGIVQLRDLVIDEPPTFQPRFETRPTNTAPIDLASWAQSSGARPKGFAFATVRDYADAYRSGAVTPEQVAEKFLTVLHDSEAHQPALRAFIAVNRDDVMAQARACTRRWRAGKPLGVFDGVPVAVKDEMDMVPYGTTWGTRFLGKTPAREDAAIVARLRATGALLLGKANMHEIGFVPVGLNPHHGTPRNPYNPSHFTGGSSSGPGAAVAAGFCPVAIGADGGGSIRIPAAFCGVFGLKATFGRISESSSCRLCWSVAHNGPIAGTARDLALGYAVMAGPDPRDPNSLHQPPITLDGFEHLDLKDLTIGVFSPWFKHATPAMVESCEQMVARFQAMGARVQEIEIPELEAARVAHLIIIASEISAMMDCYDPEHHSDFGLDIRTNLALARTMTARDYVQANRVRTRAIAYFERAFEQVDVIVTPATALTAPEIRPDALAIGESDLTTLTEIMRFAFVANLTGHPAISFPAGYDAQGLPVGMQAIGRGWEEHVLLRLAHAAEQVVERRKPQVHYRLLPG